MIDYIKFFTENPNGVLSTIDNGTPKARMFLYLWNKGNKIYFCTASYKNVSKQIKETPRVSFCAFKPDFSETITVVGNAVFVDDRVGKQRALDENSVIKGIYHEAANPDFELFYIAAERLETFSYAEGTKYEDIKK
jgi:uncharacterized pyridoxamine 5'-phosphate oxidase family protein